MNAEYAPEGRLVTPNTWTSLGTHVVTSLGSHGARVGGEVGVLTLLPNKSIIIKLNKYNTCRHAHHVVHRAQGCHKGTRHSRADSARGSQSAHRAVWAVWAVWVSWASWAVWAVWMLRW